MTFVRFYRAPLQIVRIRRSLDRHGERFEASFTEIERAKAASDCSRWNLRKTLRR
jgi:hypothetical protein